MRFLSPRASWYADGDRLLLDDHAPGEPEPEYLLDRGYLVPILVIMAFGVAGLTFMIVNLALDPTWQPTSRCRRQPLAPGFIASLLLTCSPAALIPWLHRRDQRSVRRSAPRLLLTRTAVLAWRGIGKTAMVPWDAIVSIGRGKRKTLLLTLTDGSAVRIYGADRRRADAITFYWQHREQRERIGTEESRRRMLSG